MTRNINQFLKLVKCEYPYCFDEINVSVSQESNYHQYRGVDGRMRAELNYNSPVKYNIEISFPNVGRLYSDICFYVDCIWNTNNVIATFDYTGRHYFKFTI
jgi:hypothetical protein